MCFTGYLFRDEFAKLNNFLMEKGLNTRGNETRDAGAGGDEDEDDDEDEDCLDDEEDDEYEPYEPSDEDKEGDGVDKDATMGTDPGSEEDL